MKIKRFLLMLFIVVSVLLFSNNVLALEEKGTFTELQNLINNTTDTLKLEKDYVNSGSEGQITINKNIVLDLNGHVINADFKSNIFYVSSGYSLTIEDSNKTAIHKFDVDEWSLATLNEENGKVTINGGCITGGNYFVRNSVGAAVHLNNSTLILKSGNIVGNKISEKYQFGAGIGAENNSTIIINGGMVSYNSAAWECYGGGIYLNNSDLTINGGTISYNYGNYGGGINVYDGSNLTVNDGIISNNIAGHNGGGIAIMVLDANVSKGVMAKATINGGIIENNKVTTTWIGVGAGISTCKGSDLTINDGLIQKNAAARGGGIGAWTGGNIKILGGVISENVSTEDTTPTDGSFGNHGAGVFFDTYFISGYGSVDAQLTVGGNAVITGNINSVSNKEDNLFLANDQTINIGANEYSPTNKMNVGITMANPGVFTVSETDYAENFYSDNVNYYVIKENNNLKCVEDKVAPTGEIIFEEKTFTSFLNTITFGLFFKDKFDVTITANDNNEIKSIEYYISDIGMSLDEVKAITNWIEYEKFSIDSDDKYIIYAKITDRAENVTYLSSDGFVFDKTLPEVSGIDTNNGVYYTTQKFTVDDDYIDKVLIDGVEVSEYVLPGNMDKTYEIDVYDKAGNFKNISVTMKSISSISELLDKYTIENVTIDNKEDIESVKNKVSNIDKTYATDSEKEELQAITDKCDLLLDAIIDKYISKVEFTVTVPRAEQTVADNTFTITSKYDDVVISIKEWKINGGSEVLPSDYVFEKDKLYIPILKVERKNQTYYFNENTTLTIHGSDWSNGEDTYKLKDHKSYGYVKELSDGSFIIDEMLIKAGSRIPNYVFITGDEQEFSQGKINNYSFKLDVDYSLFDTLTIGDLALTEDNDFEINEEENTITFKNNGIAKLNTLEIGNHTITVKFTNDKIVTGTLIINEFVKETVTISGLIYEDKIYDKKPIEPKGTLTVSGNKVPIDDIEVWYENQSNWTKSIEPPINAGNYKVYYNIPESNENYQGSVSYTFKIEKANPKYLLSTKLIGVKGNKLSDVELPDGFSWADEHDELIVGEKEYNVIFTPENTNNYNILDNIKLSVYTKDIFMVNTLVDGGNGSITTGKEVIEGDKFEIELNPNKGYMINNILLIDPSLPDPDNIIYIAVDTIEDNKYKLTVDKPYTVKVSFKKIEYEVVLGSNQTYVINKDKEALFRINADYSLFGGKVYVDDILLDQKDYSSEEGSTIIKLKKEFSDSLKVGQHELKVEFSDGGLAITNFVIEELKEENPASEENPKTGDNITSYLIIGSLSLISLAGCGLYLNRKRFN